MWRDIIHGRFQGIPIHVMLIHFPIGLFTGGALSDIGSLLWTEANLQTVSFFCIAGGLVTGVAAMLFGFMDYISLGSKPAHFQKAGRHGLLQLSAWFLFLVTFLLKLPHYPILPPPSVWMLLLEIVGLLMVFTGNHFGGELVYKQGVGLSEPIVPAEPPTEPAKPAEPTKPAEPAKSIEPAKPAEPAEPQDPMERIT